MAHKAQYTFNVLRCRSVTISVAESVCLLESAVVGRNKVYLKYHYVSDEFSLHG